MGVTSAALHQLSMKVINVVTILEDGLDEKYSLLYSQIPQALLVMPTVVLTLSASIVSEKC